MNFTLDWFKEESKKELESLIIKEQQIKVKKEEIGLGLLEAQVPTVSAKLYRTLKLVNNTLTLVMNDGSLITKMDVTPELFNNIRNASSEEQIISLISGNNNDEFEEEKALIKDVNSILENDEFEERDGAIYLKGINRSIPKLLVKKFAEVEKDGEEYIALKRFFMWCCLNPRAEVADSLYDFLMENDFKITKQGFFVALRNVVKTQDANHELVDAISNAYNKIRSVWKKNPQDYRIERDSNGGYSLHKVSAGIIGEEIVGNLATLYQNLPDMSENHYTDNYTHTFDIRIGKVVNMPPEKCSWSTRDCAEAGLHFAGHTAPYVLCGDTTVFTLHNPMKVVGIGNEKGRCWEYLPFMTTTVEEANEIMNSSDFDFMELDEKYAIDELNELEEKVKNGFSVEAKKHSFNLPKMSSEELNTIVSRLSEIKNVLSKRVQAIV